MADRDFLVTISGAALSLLFYENVRSIGDQMGFLLGQSLRFVVKEYTDADNQIEIVKIHTNVETVVSCPLPDLLHNSTGKINKEKLKELLCDKSKQVIGWFRFRRNNLLVPTMRDKILHKEFASYFSETNGVAEEFFLTCLLSSSTSADRGTHKFRHVFLRRRRGTFEPVSLKINNLGNDSFRHDGSDYKLAPTRKLPNAPDVFTKIVEDLNLDLTRMAGLESAIAIEKAAEQYLNKLIPEVCESDLEVAELERQVRELKEQIALRKINRKLKINGNSNFMDKDCETVNVSNDDEGRTVEKLSSTWFESPDIIDNSPPIPKNRSTSTSQTPIQKTKNTTATCIEKSVNQGKSRRLAGDTLNSSAQEPLVHTMSEMKVDITANTLARNRRSLGVSEIVKESICKGEGIGISVGRGKGKCMQEFTSGLRKPKIPGPTDTRSSSERSSFTQMFEPDSPKTNSVQSPLPQVSYSDAAKKNIDNTRSASNSPNNQ